MHFCLLVIHNPEDNLDDIMAPYQENNTGDVPKQYLQFEEDNSCDVDPKTGQRGYWTNPDSQWDWWTLGGKFRKNGFFVKKGRKGDIGEEDAFGTKVDKKYKASARFKDIDWKLIEEHCKKECKRNWDDAHKNLKNIVKSWKELEFEFGLLENDTLDTYTKRTWGTHLRPYAMILDDEWYTIPDDCDMRNEYLKNLDGDKQLSIVDCHM